MLPHHRQALWQSTSDDGFEHVHLAIAESSVVADGVIVRRTKEATYRTHYFIECDGGWRVRKIVMTSVDAAARQLTLCSNGEGRWVDEINQHVISLDGCIDIDIAASPFTNTIPIGRLQLSAGQSQPIDVVFLDPATFTFTRAAQRYSHIGENPRKFRYESVGTGFTSELPVDGDGLLLEYPGYFRRTW